jgi:hypothetical protein
MIDIVSRAENNNLQDTRARKTNSKFSALVAENIRLTSYKTTAKMNRASTSERSATCIIASWISLIWAWLFCFDPSQPELMVFKLLDHISSKEIHSSGAGNRCQVP